MTYFAAENCVSRELLNLNNGTLFDNFGPTAAIKLPCSETENLDRRGKDVYERIGLSHLPLGTLASKKFVDIVEIMMLLGWAFAIIVVSRKH